MNTNQQLEIQAYVDGQLAAADARRVERQMTDDPAGAALAAEIRMVREAVRSGEPAHTVPETRDFYFSQIRRRIDAEESVAARVAQPTATGFNWIRSMLLPAVGVACLTAVAVLTTRNTPRPYVAGEVNIASDEMNAISFRSDMNQMTVVYLFDKQPAAAADTTPNPFVD